MVGINAIKQSEEMKGTVHALLTYTLTFTAYVLDNYAEFATTICAVVTTGFVAWHYLKSGKLKQAEKKNEEATFEKIRIETELLEMELEKAKIEEEKNDPGIYD